MARILNTCNLDSDYPNESFVTGLPVLHPAKLQEICNLINNATNGPGFTAPRYYKVVDDDYELQPGFKP